MKKIAVLLGFVASFLCFAQSANAQYSTQIIRRGADFVDLNGKELTDAQLIEIVGSDIYNETVVGARRQFKIGRGLVWGGCAGIVGGTAEMIAGTIIVGRNASRDPRTQVINRNTTLTFIGTSMVITGGALLGLGAVALTVGIPFVAIGKGRLNWVEDQTKKPEVSCRLGLTENGVGLALNF